MSKTDDIRKLRKMVLEETIKASRDYMLKEKVREEIQALVLQKISSGQIKNEEALKEFWKTVEMASNALKMVPFDALKAVAKK